MWPIAKTVPRDKNYNFKCLHQKTKKIGQRSLMVNSIKCLRKNNSKFFLQKIEGILPNSSFQGSIILVSKQDKVIRRKL